MSTTGAREAATAARREQIMRAAVALLAEHGYQATTFEAIRRHAGLSSKRLITYHFSTKDELLAAIAENVVGEADAVIVLEVEAASGARERLAAVIRASVRFIAGDLERMRALRQIILNDTHIWGRHHDVSVRRLAALLADGQRTGGLRRAEPDVLASALRGAIDSMYEPLAAGYDPEACAENLVALFDRGLQPDQPQRDGRASRKAD